MPAPLNVDKEQVRMLVLSIGVREAARKLDIAEGTVQAWSARGNWLEATRPSPAILPQPVSMRGATVATKPADALAECLADDSRETRISLSRGARRMAQEVETAPLEQAGDAFQVGKLAALLHGWEQAGGGTSINILIT